jgi:hypothetical protein
MTRDFGVPQRSGKQGTEHCQRSEISEVGHRLYQRGYVVACEGNLSVRLDAERILLMPTGACKRRSNTTGSFGDRFELRHLRLTLGKLVQITRLYEPSDCSGKRRENN